MNTMISGWWIPAAAFLGGIAANAARDVSEYLQSKRRTNEREA